MAHPPLQGFTEQRLDEATSHPAHPASHRAPRMVRCPGHQGFGAEESSPSSSLDPATLTPWSHIMHHALLTTAASLAICGFLITGCDGTANRDANSSTTTATASTASPATGTPAERDNTISSVIHNHLEVDKDISYTGKMISITTTNGVVLLNGTVHNEGDHQKILATVRKVDGVERIDDRILIQ
jgi:hypothetical protein